MDLQKVQAAAKKKRWAKIARLVCAHSGVKLADMCVSASRGANAQARYLAIYLCHTQTTATHEELAKYFEVSKPTVSHAIVQARRALKSDKASDVWVRIAAKKVIEKL